MDLPAPLRAAVDAALEGVPLADLRHASAVLSQRYRGEVRDGRLHLDAELAVKAYLATRMPATYAAIRASFSVIQEVLPDFAPLTMLDLGAGPGTAFWSARDCWPSIERATLIEASPAARNAGDALSRHAGEAGVTWRAGDVLEADTDLVRADLVTLAYVLDELPPAALDTLVERLWSVTGGLLVVVEPGTPAGWQRVLSVRARLVQAGAAIVAPCPHEKPCPLTAPDWCHFSRKVARSRLHRLAKMAEVPWEEEKFIYLAASRLRPPAGPAARVIAPPRASSGQVRLKLCRDDGRASETVLTRRDGEAYRTARRLDWGDAW